MKYGTDRIPQTHEFGRVFAQNVHHFVALQDIMSEHIAEWRGCGSYMIDGQTTTYVPEMFGKQASLYDCAKESSHAFEIGVHGGHSVLIMLLANPTMHVSCVDICNYSHTIKCIEYLKQAFPGRITFYQGSSLDVLPHLLQVPQFDLAHIDGAHQVEIVTKEVAMLVPLLRPNAYLLFDDYSIPGLEHQIYNVWAPWLQFIRIPPCEGIYGSHLITRFNP